jgi:DNA polymerase-4
MDAFFASVELLSYPELIGQPVVVGGRNSEAPLLDATGQRQFARLGHYVGRGVATTSTYEARALGVFSGMGLMQAGRLAPDAVLLPANFDAYKEYSRRFKQAVARIAPCIEDRGIDEIYIDLSALKADSQTLAAQLKQAVRDATGLSCSIGITPNKLLSKLASDMNKPDGTTLLRLEDVPDRIWPLPAGKINGIGPKATARLHQLGIVTVGDLATADIALLQETFGLSYAAWMRDAAHGHDNRPLIMERAPKSISRETTFETDMHPKRHREALGQAFTALCVRVAEDLNRKGYVGRNIGIKLRFDNFETVTRATTLTQATAGAAVIRHAAGQCLKRIVLGRSIRLLGVRVGHLEEAELEAGDVQASLF